MSIFEAMNEIQSGQAAFMEGLIAGYRGKHRDNPYCRGWLRLELEVGRPDLMRQWDRGYEKGQRDHAADLAHEKAVDDLRSDVR